MARRSGTAGSATVPALSWCTAQDSPSQNLMSLARSLSDRFAVYVPDRRGRGMSGPYREDYGARTEAEYLGALLDRTQAHNVFGLSVGLLSLPGGAKAIESLTPWRLLALAGGVSAGGLGPGL
jgi:pimeloyl-ACP methyl ester carboxylesterase